MQERLLAHGPRLPRGAFWSMWGTWSRSKSPSSRQEASVVCVSLGALASCWCHTGERWGGGGVRSAQVSTELFLLQKGVLFDSFWPRGHQRE